MNDKKRRGILNFNNVPKLRVLELLNGVWFIIKFLLGHLHGAIHCLSIFVCLYMIKIFINIIIVI
jgi:hypothetical protein